jgi:hypothetical protein
MGRDAATGHAMIRVVASRPYWSPQDPPTWFRSYRHRLGLRVQRLRRPDFLLPPHLHRTPHLRGRYRQASAERRIDGWMRRRACPHRLRCDQHVRRRMTKVDEAPKRSLSLK